MRIAFCFGGQLRTAEYTTENFLRYIGDLLPNVDFFLHTWDENGYKKRYGNSLKIQEICKEQGIEDPKHLDPKILKPFDDLNVYEVINKLQPIYKFRSIEIENFNDYRIAKIGGTIFPPHFYSWYKVILLKKNYEELRNFKYDFVVKTRPDILIPHNITLQDEIENCKLDTSKFYAQGTHSNRVNDVFWMATSNVMDIASEFFLKSPARSQTASFLFDYLLSENISVTTTKFGKFAIYRPESIPISSLNFEKCYNDDRDWYWTKNDTFRYNV